MSTQSTTDFLTFPIRGRIVLVDADIYYQIFNVRASRHHHKQRYVGDIIGLSLGGSDYPSIVIGRNPKKLVLLSRFIMNPPADMVVDHINGDIYDNRRENLRIANRRQNALNAKRRNSSGFTGVSLYKANNGRSYCHVVFYDRNGKLYSFHTADCHEHRILAAYAHDKFVLLSNDEDYAPLNFESFKYEPFRSFLLETDLNKFKIKCLTPGPVPGKLPRFEASFTPAPEFTPPALLDTSISSLKML
jgi:hypothetical protein